MDLIVETVKRALSRIGERRYNLFTNNCEHFATWCKTGVSYSKQI
ncbi:MAG: lecithin retinol acyltransferase family protein [Clostridium paraputrificum]